jgi:hypothetical protein
MSNPNGAPAAAWYPDPQSPGRVRWWDGTNWTEHVSVPASPMQSEQIAIESSVPQIDEADAALAAADAEHAAADPDGQHVTYIGRHAAGANPAPKQPSRAPQIRPRQRTEVPGGSLLSA